MDIDSATAAGRSEYNGQTYYFCSPGCKRDFDKDPAKFVGQGQHQHPH
jgi:Cu+-exporting ATPase